MCRGVVLKNGIRHIHTGLDGIANGKVLMGWRVRKIVGIQDCFEIDQTSFQVVDIAARNLSLADRVEANAFYIRLEAVGTFW